LGDDSRFPGHKLERTRKMERHMLRHVSMILVEKIKDYSSFVIYHFFSKKKRKRKEHVEAC
jgi:hypothetical protein